MKTNFNDFINESIRDKMESKSEEEIRKIFKEKYGIDYIEIDEVIKQLNENGVICNLGKNPYEPIEITAWEITRFSGSQGWGIGSTVSEKMSQYVATVLKENLGEFWDEGKDEFRVEKNKFSTYSVDHKEALIILSKIKKM